MCPVTALLHTGDTLSDAQTNHSDPGGRRPVSSRDPTPSTDRVGSQTPVSPADPLPSHYTVMHRDEVLDPTVPKDDDSMPEGTNELPDPTAADEDVEPEIFGSAGLQRKLRRLIKKHKKIFAVKLPPNPAKISAMTFKVDKAGWQADRRTRQYPRPLSRDKEVALEKWIEAALEAKIISEAPTVPNWSQILLVMKSNGKEYRFCVDYTVLNSFMESAG